MNQKILHELFEYKDGVLYNKIQRGTRGLIGKPSGSLNDKGYLSLVINGKRYLNHRLIFLMHYGYLPKTIDHKDNNSLNNKIENLRACNQSLNMANSSIKSTNTSGYKGVSFRSDTKKWQAALMKNYKKTKIFLVILNRKQFL